MMSDKNEGGKKKNGLNNNVNPGQEPDSERRTFLKRSAITAGLATTGVASLPSLAAACDPPEGNYSEKNYTHWMKDEVQIKDSKCANSFNSGTRIDGGGTLIYWNSADHGDGTYTHHFSNQTHGEHFNEDYDTCSWYHSQGLNKQRWRARDDLSGNTVATPSNTNWAGAFPPVSSDGDFTLTNTAFTGISLLVAYAWPTSSPMVAASEIVYALAQDLNEGSSSLWDAQLDWDYGGDYKDCLSHFVKFNVEATEPETDLYTQEGYWNDYLYAEIAHHDYVGSPTWSSSSSSLSTTESTGDNGIAPPREDVEVGDIIYPDDEHKVRVESIHTHTKKQPGAPKEKVNEEEYKKKYPADYEEHGAPEYLLHLPATSTTTTLIGVILD